MHRTIVACTLLVALSSTCLADSKLKQAWKEVTTEHGEWGYGYKHERRGQICDTHRRFGQDATKPDNWPGCSVVFIADPDDEYDLGTVAAGEQDNFLNTQHYLAAFNLHDKGFLGSSLPRPAEDINPVCLIANVGGRLVLGYEEGEGDKLLPCPGHDEGVPITEEHIREGLEGTRDLEDMCTQCYAAVCTGDQSVRARDCGNSGDGGVDLEDEATFVKQADPVYHCHLTMADEGACDFVQYDQHESSRTYYMDYSVLCGWDNIQYLNVTFCDCTKVAGTNNGCRRYEAMEMAYVGVVCGNCNGVGFNEDRAFESIFSPLNEKDVFDGQCAKYKTSEEGWGKNYSKMMCSKGIWCPNGYNGGDNCKFHCDNFGKDSEVFYDAECGDYPDFPTEVCNEAGTKCFHTPKEETGSWTDGEARCVELGGHLASITSEEDNALVKQLAINVGSSVWIGFNDRTTEGTFTWSDASVAEFTNWAANEPNDFGDGEDCAELRNQGGQWNDNNCDQRRPWVCSKGSPFESSDATRRLLAAETVPADITLDTAFDWGHVISEVEAIGWVHKKTRRSS